MLFAVCVLVNSHLHKGNRVFLQRKVSQQLFRQHQEGGNHFFPKESNPITSLNVTSHFFVKDILYNRSQEPDCAAEPFVIISSEVVQISKHLFSLLITTGYRGLLIYKVTAFFPVSDVYNSQLENNAGLVKPVGAQSS